jgi:ferredoxin
MSYSMGNTLTGAHQMAEREDRLPYNCQGKFYVTDDCIDCDVCRQVAPDYFKLHDDDPYSFVFKQPMTAEGLAECEEALNGCPVDAIGDDGE